MHWASIQIHPMTRRTKKRTPEGWSHCRSCDKILPEEKFGWANKAKNKRRHQCTNCRNIGRWVLRSVKSDYEQLLQKQNNQCAICGIHNEISRLGIDHNHKTQEIRGLLCHDCNSGIASFDENRHYLAKAILYLITRGQYEDYLDNFNDDDEHTERIQRVRRKTRS